MINCNCQTPRDSKMKKKKAFNITNILTKLFNWRVMFYLEILSFFNDIICCIFTKLIHIYPSLWQFLRDFVRIKITHLDFSKIMTGKQSLTDLHGLWALKVIDIIWKLLSKLIWFWNIKIDLYRFQISFHFLLCELCSYWTLPDADAEEWLLAVFRLLRYELWNGFELRLITAILCADLWKWHILLVRQSNQANKARLSCHQYFICDFIFSCKFQVRTWHE